MILKLHLLEMNNVKRLLLVNSREIIYKPNPLRIARRTFLRWDFIFHSLIHFESRNYGPSSMVL